MALNELQAIVDDLAQRLDVPIVLEDHEHRMVVYSSQSEAIDDIRRDTILRREARTEVKDWFRQFGILQATAPLRIPSHCELGILGRLCAPIWFRTWLLGFLFMIDNEAKLDDGAIALVQQAASHAGLLLYEEELARRLSASVLSHLLSADTDLRDAAARQLTEQGITPADASHAVVYVRRADDIASPEWREQIDEALFELSRKIGHVGLVQAARHDHGVLLVPLAAPDEDRAAVEVAQEILAALARRYRPSGADDCHPARFIAGIGDPQRHLTAAMTSYRQAQLAATVAAAVPAVGDLARWADLGAFRMLAQIPVYEDCERSLDPRLVMLLGTDPELVRTVEAYLDLAGDAKRTAEYLHLHRATLYYRLDKAQQLTGVDLRDGNDRLALHMSLKLARLVGRWTTA